MKKKVLLKNILLLVAIHHLISIVIFISVSNSLNRESIYWKMDLISHEEYQENAIIYNWVTECNQLEEDIFVLVNKHYENSKYYTTYCIYRTNFNYYQYDYEARLSKRWISEDVLSISFSNFPEENTNAPKSNGTILYAECISKNGYVELIITEDEHKKNYILEETNNNLSTYRPKKNQ